MSAGRFLKVAVPIVAGLALLVTTVPATSEAVAAGGGAAALERRPATVNQQIASLQHRRAHVRSESPMTTTFLHQINWRANHQRNTRPALLWTDDFNGPASAAPDPAKWLTMVDMHDHNELEYYTAQSSNVSLDGQGHLAITALRQTYKGSGRTWEFTSGCIKTGGVGQAPPRFCTTYGSIQASIKLPAGQGLWPAFWAVGADEHRVGWPQCGEIDIMENLGQDPFTIFGSIHGPTTYTSPEGYGLSTSHRATVSLAEAFHVYGVTWSPTLVQMTLDGVPYATYTPRSLSRDQQWVFDKPFSLILNLAVGGDWPGDPDATTVFPATMLVDWVRVYTLRSKSGRQL